MHQTTYGETHKILDGELVSNFLKENKKILTDIIKEKNCLYYETKKLISNPVLNYLNKIPKESISKQLKSFRERLNDKLSEIVGEDPKCLLGLAELLGAAVALKSVIIEYIDPSVLLKNKKKSSIRRLAASMESMSLLQEIEKRTRDNNG